MGKEWTTPSGQFEHNNPQWVKVISPHGEVHSKNWISNYKRINEALNIEFPGTDFFSTPKHLQLLSQINALI